MQLSERKQLAMLRMGKIIVPLLILGGHVSAQRGHDFRGDSQVQAMLDKLSASGAISSVVTPRDVLQARAAYLALRAFEGQAESVWKVEDREIPGPGGNLGTLNFMVHTQLFTSQIVLQIVLGTLVPIGLLALVQVVKPGEILRRRICTLAAALTLIGIFAMRWNVVVGGQLFSKSFLGYTNYKMAFAAREGLLPAIALLILPFLILWRLLKLLPPWAEQKV